MGKSFFCRRTLSKDLDDFLYSLLGSLDRLDASLCRGSVSLRWFVEVMNFLEGMQIELLSLLKKYKPPGGRAQETYLKQYMWDTVALLDFCNLLKLAISRFDRHRLMVDILIQKQKHAIIPKTIEFDISSIESKSNLLVRMMVEAIKLGNRFPAKGRNKYDETITVTLLAAKSTMVVITTLLISTMASPVSIELGACDLPLLFPQLNQLVEKLSTLARSFQERISGSLKGSGSVLVEQEKVQKAMMEIGTQVEEGKVDEKTFLRSMELLRIASIELREGTEKFDAALDKVFDVVMRSRNEMLALLRDWA
ncbi:hypothetical protein HPP92_004051 [Vanilla planifolia]|uniref:Uncharacterized protein n=1 Tax=Vanilla planifolia TaxID=51239 RepID=A0A835VKH9_VANPL|nr:hypothetical protein HPP92_004051 [Vanilla planifolia]